TGLSNDRNLYVDKIIVTPAPVALSDSNARPTIALPAIVRKDNDPNNRKLINRYDQRNELTETRQAEIYAYESSTPGHPYFTASPTTRNTYDAFGEVRKQSSLRNSGADDTVGSTDDQWLDTYYYYDRNGRRRAQVDPLGFRTDYEYDAFANLTRTTE